MTSGPMCSLCNGTGEAGPFGGVPCRSCRGWGETHPDGEAFRAAFPGPDPALPDPWATAEIAWPGMTAAQLAEPAPF